MIDSNDVHASAGWRGLFFGPHELRAGWRLFIFIAIVVTLTGGANLLIRRLMHGADDTTLFLVRQAEDITIIVLVSWVMGRMEGRTLADYGLPWRRMFRGQFWQGALLGFASLSILVLLLRFAGVFRFGTIALHGAGILKWAAVWALVFILVAVREEFRSRGYGLFTLSAGIGFWPAAVLWAIFFASTHYGNSGENWIGLLNVGLFALLVSLLLQRTGNLWMPIGFHMAFDWGETFFYGVADSGHVMPGHLLNSSSSGPVWLSGGTVGPEGSVLCSVMIIVLWLICAARLREIRYPRPAGVPVQQALSQSAPAGVNE